MPFRGSTAASLVDAKSALSLLSMPSIALCSHALQLFRLLMTNLSLLVCLKDGNFVVRMVESIQGLFVLVAVVGRVRASHSVVM